ncbi:MAG: hypothetical protein ACR2ND_14380 [Solirubrobacteraceae bacterium]
MQRTATLCNVPVSLWLYFGPEYVPVRQVRRALRTYGGRYRATPKEPARHSARRIAELFAGGADMTRSDRTRLIHAIVEGSTAGTVDRDALTLAARRLFDPERSSRTVGPAGARLSPEAWVRTIEAKLTGLDGLDAFDERAFEDARLAHHHHMADYIERQSEFAGVRDIGAMFEPVTLDHLLNTACLDTLTVLGFLELSRERAPASARPAHRTRSAQPSRRYHRPKTSAKSPARPPARPAGTAHGKKASACSPSVPRRPGAASP